MKRVIASKRSGLAVWAAGCLLVACAILAPALALAANPAYGWAKRLGGTSHEQGYAVAVDASGNVYVIGQFMDTVNFAADFGGSDVQDFCWEQ